MPHGPQIAFTPSQRLPDPAFEILHPRGEGLRLFSARVEQLATGCYWAEGPVWFGDGRFLLWSDIPNNRMLRWDECNGVVSEFRKPADNANGHARDGQGRLVSCEHLTRRVTRTEHDGRITVLADSYQGKRLNSPNDITVAKDGSVWFTDPAFGIASAWEGEPAPSELSHGVYRISPERAARARPDAPLRGDDGLTMAIADLQGSNGLAFSPDEAVLYVVESRAQPHRKIWRYAMQDGLPGEKSLYVDAGGPGAYDGIAVDTQGNVWCGFGASGNAPAGTAEQLDGVRVYAPDGVALAHIHLPERCANLCFGGAKRNRLFMAASSSLYALHVNAQGAV